MFTITFQGSIVKVDHPSEILVTHEGVTINLIGKRAVDSKLEAVADAIGKALPDMTTKVGRKPDPNSLRSRVHNFTAFHAAKGLSRQSIIQLATVHFSGANASSLSRYVYTAYPA